MTVEAYFAAMAGNNAWANHRLLNACAALSPAALTARRASFFPSIKLTLDHILECDRYYIDALEGGSLGQDAYCLPVPEGFEALRHEQSHWDGRLLALCRRLTATDLTTEIRLVRTDKVQIDRMDRVLLHLFQHQIHHRSQVHAMLAETSVPPPQLDEFFLAEDVPRRTEDFAQLHWSETDF